MRVAISEDRSLRLSGCAPGVCMARWSRWRKLSMVAGLALVAVAPPASVYGQTLIQVAQESAPGAGDFDCNVLGVITAWSTSLTAAEFYDYGGSNDVSTGLTWSSGPMPNTSHIFLANTPQGLCLTVIHDAPRVENGGGGASMALSVVGNQTVLDFMVRDDIGDGYVIGVGFDVQMLFATHDWNNRNTDGFVVGNLVGPWVVYAEFGGAPTGLDNWRTYSENGDSLALNLQAGRRVRFARVTSITPRPALAMYTFDDGTFHDVGSGVYHALPSNGTAPEITPGRSGLGAQFAGTDGLAVDLNLNPACMPQVTIGGWFKASDTGRRYVAISHDNGGADRDLRMDNQFGPEPGWFCLIGNQPNPNEDALGPLPAIAGEWQFAAAVYDSNAQSAQLFVDGAVIQSSNSIPGGGAARLRIGLSPNNPGGTRFAGFMDDVFIIGEALSVERLEEIRANGYRHIPTCATVFRHPTNATTCPNVGIGFSVDAGGSERSGTLTYQWQLEAQPGVWVTLGNDPTPLPGGGSAFAIPPAAESTSIGVIGRTGSFGVRCVVENACGSVNSFPATLTVRSAPPGDLNCDGLVNNFDISPFVLALSDPAAYATEFPACDYLNADINCDTRVNNFDIDPFVELLSGG